MRRVIAAIAVCLALTVAPGASAQPARAAPTPAEIAGQATFGTSALLARYMAQLAAAGTPPSQADIDEATRQYLTNGAAVTSVPNSGPGAAYFHNGAAVTGVPSSGPGAAYFQNGAAVLAYQAPRSAPGPEAREAPAGGSYPGSAVRPSAAPTQPGAPTAAATVQPAPASTISVEPNRVVTVQTCPPGEIEAAIAFGRQFAAVNATPTSASTRMSSPATTSEPPPAAASPVEPAPTSETTAGTAPGHPPGPSVLSGVALAAGGALFGGLVVALWSLPRKLRAARR